MTRYIDAEKVIDTLDQSINIFDATDRIKVLKAADVVEVVRCKDCKYKEGSVCDYSAVYVRPNGYCQWGERRDDDEERS